MTQVIPDDVFLPEAVPEPPRHQPLGGGGLQRNDRNLPIEQRVPPQNVELEMAVLGGIMLEPAEAYPLAADILDPDSFYLDGHALMFRTMGELLNRGIPPDAQAMIDELRSRDLLDRVGGPGVVMGMLNAVPTAANVEHHAMKLAEKAQARAIIRACTLVIEKAYKQEMPVDDLQELFEQHAIQLGQRRGAGYISIGDTVREYWGQLGDRDEELMRRREAGEVNPQVFVGGIPSGFAAIDRYTNGLRKSELTIVAARPSVGKTALALNLGHNLAVMQGLPVAIFSLEMSAEVLSERLLCVGSRYIDPETETLAGIGSHRLQNPDLTAGEWAVLTKSFQRLVDAPLYIDESSVLTIGALKSKCRQLVAKHGVQCVIVDYLQLLSGSQSKGDNRVQEVSEISRGLKQIARELKIPVVALSQLSRQVTGRAEKRPVLSDLRESGSIEQDADVVLFLWDDGMDPPPGSMKCRNLEIAKNRNGPTGSEKLLWFAEITRYLDPTPEGVANEIQPRKMTLRRQRDGS